MKKTTPAQTKKFSLTSEETKNLKGREMAIDYILDLIKRDINMYMYMDIVPRLGLDPKGTYILSEDRTELEVETKIITDLKDNGRN